MTRQTAADAALQRVAAEMAGPARHSGAGSNTSGRGLATEAGPGLRSMRSAAQRTAGGVAAAHGVAAATRMWIEVMKTRDGL